MIVEIRLPQIHARFQRVLLKVRGGNVVDQLIITLVSGDRERAGVAENRERDPCTPGHAHDGRVRIVGDRPVGVAHADADPSLLHRVGRKHVRPRQTEIRLIGDLSGFLADDQLSRMHLLMRALVARGDRVVVAAVGIAAAAQEIAEAAVVVDSRRFVALRDVLMLKVEVRARRDVGGVRRALWKARDDRILPGAIRRRVIAQGQPLRGIEIARQKHAAHRRDVTLILNFIDVQISEQGVAHDRKSACRAELAAVMHAMTQRRLRRIA